MALGHLAEGAVNTVGLGFHLVGHARYLDFQFGRYYLLFFLCIGNVSGSAGQSLTIGQKTSVSNEGTLISQGMME